MMTAKQWSLFKENLGAQNPVFVQVLGICSTLAVTNVLKNTLVMCLGLIFVTALSNLTLSLLRAWIPPRIRMMVEVLVIACLVMLGLALPFAYLHARAGGVPLKVFGGILLGISFVLLNNVSGHLGLLHDWTPWLAASVPSVVYLLMSLAAFSWLVRYR